MALTETSRTGWFSRLRQSFGGIIVGFIFFILAFVLLWHNEGRAVKTAKGLKEGQAEVVSISSETVLDENNGKLVHVSGLVNTTDTLADQLLGVRVFGLKLKRSTEMYQWVEKSSTQTKEKLGGAEEKITTYTYEKQWRSGLVSSTSFKEAGHDNPQILPVGAHSVEAQTFELGSFPLNPSLRSRINAYRKWPLAQVNDSLVLKLKSDIRHPNDNPYEFNKPLRHQNLDGNLFIGKGTASAPEIGDIRISYSYVPVGQYSIVARQDQGQLVKHLTSKGTTIEMLRPGLLSAEEMFEKAFRDNKIITWLLRAGGFFLMFMGLSLVLKPLVVLASVVPFVARILNFGTRLFSGIVAGVLSLITIGVAWVFYRPILGISILVIATGLFLYFYNKSKDKEVKEELRQAYLK